MESEIGKSMDNPMDSWIIGFRGQDFHKLASRVGGVRSIIVYWGRHSRPPVSDNLTISNQ